MGCYRALWLACYAAIIVCAQAADTRADGRWMMASLKEIMAMTPEEFWNLQNTTIAKTPANTTVVPKNVLGTGDYTSAIKAGMKKPKAKTPRGTGTRENPTA